MKKCIKCLITKDFQDFYIKKTAKDGFCNTCKDCVKSDMRQRGKNKSPERKLKDKQWRQNNKQHLNEYARIRYQKNPKIKQQYNKKNQKKINEYQRNKRITDPQYKLAMNLRRRINRLLEKQFKSNSPVKMLGCSLEFLMQYLESKFYSNPLTNEPMTWANHNQYGWHLDHIKQLASFDLTNPEQFAQACHYTNLQPLWAKANQSKNKTKLFFSF